MADGKFYRDIYDKVYARDPGYAAGHGMHFIPDIVRDLTAAGDGAVVVDCGCGRHILTDALVKALSASDTRVNVFGVDVHKHTTIPDGVTFLQKPLWDIPEIKSGSACVITSFDVLEHLLEEDVDRTVDEWHRCLKPGGVIYATIASRLAVCPAPEGISNLHLTVKPIEWWRKRFMRLFSVPSDHPRQVDQQLVAVKEDTHC